MAVAWPWPVVPRFSVPVSRLVLPCCPVAALPLPVRPVVRQRWPVVPVRLAPLVPLPVLPVLLLVPREPLAAQELQAEWMEALTLLVEVVVGEELAVQAQAAVLVLLEVLPMEHPQRSAGIQKAEIVLLVGLLVKPWEPKVQTKVQNQRLPKVLPKVLVQRPALSAGIPLADRLHRPVLLAVPQPVPRATQGVLPALTPRPRGPANPQARTVELLIPRLPVQLPGLALPRGHRNRQQPVPVPRTLHPRPRRQRTPQLSR